MSKINDGGPAFPRSQKAALSPITDVNGDDIQSGMSLRDHFAAQIASGMAAFSGTAGVSYGPKEIAGRSYEVADAMIAARSNGEKGNG